MKIQINVKKNSTPTTIIQHYGGTAATYTKLIPQGEPFKEGAAYYINVTDNKGGTKKVRWYADKEHNDAYPYHIKVEKKPLWSFFFFENEDDVILVCKEKIDLGDPVNYDYIHDMVNKGFSYRAFWDGCWIAPKTTPMPMGKKCQLVEWATLRKEGQKMSDKLGYSEAGKGVWYE